MYQNSKITALESYRQKVRVRVNIVLSGSSGFVGEALALKLLSIGHNVYGIDQRIGKFSIPNFIKSNLEDMTVFDSIPENATFIHLAAVSTDKDCANDPIGAINSNLQATAKLAQLAEMKKANKFIFASSEWVYPESTTPKLNFENETLDLRNLNSLYAMTKLFGENLLRSMNVTNLVTLRFGIVYGPRLIGGSAFESVVRMTKEKTQIELGSLNTARRFIHVSDLVDGLVEVCSKTNFEIKNPIYNFAGTELITLKEIALETSRIMGVKRELIDLGKTPSIRNPISDSAYKYFNWVPKYDLSAGIHDYLSIT